MDGDGALNSPAHQRYEAKARTLVGVPAGAITDPMDQQLVGAMIGVLTNTSGIVVHLKLASPAFGDHPDEWRQEDRLHTFNYVGNRVEGHFCLGDDLDRGVRDPRRVDSYHGVDIGAFVFTEKACSEIARGQQDDQGYLDVKPASYVYAKTAILAMLKYPADYVPWSCWEVGDCGPPSDCEGAWALFNGEEFCMPCSAEYVTITEEGPICEGDGDGEGGGK
ncbi:MAG TPA: hypothetical protein VFO79_10240 [Xanthomonadales bacterium]|nr:hypothetical protein [Xanthomonadales bacterium]